MVRARLALSVLLGVPAMLVLILAGAAAPADKDKAPAPPLQFSIVVPENAPKFEGLGWRPVFTSDGKKIVDRGNVIDAETGRGLASVPRTVPDHVAVSPDGSTLAFPDQGFRGPGNTEHWYGVSLADAATGKVVKTVEIVDIELGRLYFPTKSMVVAMSYDRMYVIDPGLGHLVMARGGSQDTVVSPDGRQYARAQVLDPPTPGVDEKGVDEKRDSFKAQNVVILYDMMTGKETARLPLVEGKVGSAPSWTPDGRYVVLACEPMMAVIEMGDEPRLAYRFEGWQPAIPAQTVRGRYLLVGSHNWDENALLDLTTGALIPVKTPGGAKMRIAAIAPDGEHVIAGDRLARLVPEAGDR